MDLMFRLVYGTACRSTHHKFALDALKRLDADLREPWLHAFLLHHEDYLRGAKDPDDRFRDFTNHVLHVGEGGWGGAIAAAEKWYGVALETLRQRDWGHAVYACGVLSHYVTDPVMPFHTAQTERETVIHRACEWSIWRSYDSLMKVTALRHGYPEIKLGSEVGWLGAAIRMGAETAYRHYEPLAEHFLFDRAVRDPEAGLDPVCREIIAKLFGVSIQLWATVLSRLLREASVTPPRQDLTLPFLGTLLEAPRRKIVAAIGDMQERDLVAAIYDEWKRTGTVKENLPLDDRMVQEAYEAEQVARSAYGPYTPPAIGSKKSTQEATARRSDPLVDTVPQRVVPSQALPHQAVPPGPVKKKDSETREAMRSTAARSGERSEDESGVPRGQVPRPHFGARRDPGRAVAGQGTAVANVDEETESPSRSVTDGASSHRPESVKRESAVAPLELQRSTSESHRDAAASRETQRHYLAVDDDVEKAPSIGPKTAKRLAKVGIRRVQQLLDADPETLAGELEVRWVTPEMIVDWQDQARLMCRVPGLRGHDAQWLVGVGVRESESLATAKAADLLAEVTALAATAQGQAILRDGREPDRSEVEGWIASARGVRGARAA